MPYSSPNIPYNSTTAHNKYVNNNLGATKSNNALNNSNSFQTDSLNNSSSSSHHFSPNKKQKLSTVDIDELFEDIPDEFIESIDLNSSITVPGTSIKRDAFGVSKPDSNIQPSNVQGASKPNNTNPSENDGPNQNYGSDLSWGSLPDELIEDTGIIKKDDHPTGSDLSWDSLPEDLENENFLHPINAPTSIYQPSNSNFNMNQGSLNQNIQPAYLNSIGTSNQNLTSLNNAGSQYSAQNTSIAQNHFHNQNTNNNPFQTNTNSNSPFHHPPMPDELTHDVDSSTTNTWIYPTNYPVRMYQKNIVQTSLFNNTLVCLPTGLGKTFIAAVVMYNHLRWFPDSKVIFMAPTKPLVNQQMFACYDIMGVDPSQSAELTGAQPQAQREEAWAKYRVFYATPQVVQNDLEKGICPWRQLSCVVIDEAHRATGDYAYTVVIRKLTEVNHQFRVLGLSATPGSSLQTVQRVIENLQIAQVEIRTEQSLDVAEYTFTKRINQQTVPLSPNIERLLLPFQKILAHFTGKLIRKKAVFVSGNMHPGKVSSFTLIKAREVYRAKRLDRSETIPTEGDFAIAISFARSVTLLTTQGVKSFNEAIRGWRREELLPVGGRPIAKYKQELLTMPEHAQAFEVLDEVLAQPNLVSHPKLGFVKRYIESHFLGTDSSSTRAIIFAQFRDTVDEILEEIASLHPDVRATRFIGQASRKTERGLKQKEQLQTLAQFKQGVFNVLVSTSIGEEGLDIGEVDLILCYDCNSSPIRMLQRNGRTGRKRQGKVVMLLTQGREHTSFGTSKSSHKSVVNLIQSRSKKIKYSDFNPRLLPLSCNPRCEERAMEIRPCDPSEFHRGRKRRKVTDTEELGVGVGYLTYSETHFFRLWFRIEPNVFSSSAAVREAIGSKTIDLKKCALGQTRLTPTASVWHGSRSRQLVRLMTQIQTLIPIREDSPELPSMLFDAPPEALIKDDGPDRNSQELQITQHPKSQNVSSTGSRIVTPKFPDSPYLNNINNNPNSQLPNFSPTQLTQPTASALSSLSRFINPNADVIPHCLLSSDHTPSIGEQHDHQLTNQPSNQKIHLHSSKSISVGTLGSDAQLGPFSSSGELAHAHLTHPTAFDDSYISSDDSIPDRDTMVSRLDDLYQQIDQVLSQK